MYPRFLIPALMLLSACTSGMNAAVESMRYVVLPRKEAPPKLDPNFVYLRITRGSHVGLLWRGSTERSPQGPVEVYYSGSGEVIRLRNGRIVGALGLTTEWRQVIMTEPDWSAASRSKEPMDYVRTRDVMPGYRSGVRDELRLRVVPPPSRSALTVLDPATLTWFEETARDSGLLARAMGRASSSLPPTRYAVRFADGQATVVYAEQCLARDLCFSWQRWSTAMQQAAAAPAPQAQ